MNCTQERVTLPLPAGFRLTVKSFAFHLIFYLQQEHSMDDVDRVALRVTLSAILGSLGGIATAMYRGHPMPRSVGLTALSCAMTATACFGAERCAASVSKNMFHHEDNHWDTVLMCHGFGGIVGGSILGSLYIGKPAHGIVFFVPVMLFIGTGEKLYADFRDEAIQRNIRE